MNYFNILMVSLIAFAVAGVFVQIGSILLFDRTARRKNSERFNGYQPLVSVLKPVKGVDEGIYENFVSLCKQDYTNYEIIFGVRDGADPVIPIINRLISEFSDINMRIVISDRTIGHNPKVNNLENAYRKAKGEVIIMTDSDVRVGPDYISSAVAPLKKKKVGIVTAVVMITTGQRDFWSSVSALLFNGTLSCVFTLSEQLGRLNMAYGPSIALRREVLEEIGGFARVANASAEDIALGEIVYKQGYEIVLQSRIVKVIKQPITLLKEMDHSFRWLLVFKKHVPVGNLALPLFFAFPLSLLYFLVSPGKLSLSLFLFALLSRWIFMTVITLKFVKNRGMLRYIPAAFAGELLFIVIWVKALFASCMTWRGIRYRILSGGSLERLDAEEEVKEVVELA